MKNKLERASGEYYSVLGIFALVAAVGELAIKLHILPWPEGHAVWAVMGCFSEWVESRRLSPVAQAIQESRIQSDIKARTIAFFRENAVRFVERNTNTEPVENLAGYFESKPKGIMYYVLPDVFRFEICVDLDYEKIADFLRTDGFLLCDPGRLTKYVRLPTTKDDPVACYAILVRRAETQSALTTRTTANGANGQQPPRPNYTGPTGTSRGPSTRSLHVHNARANSCAGCSNT